MGYVLLRKQEKMKNFINVRRMLVCIRQPYPCVSFIVPFFASWNKVIIILGCNPPILM